MKIAIKLIYAVITIFMISSCYEDYKFDNVYTSTYFARQKPIRTLVETPNSDELTFKFASVLSGVYTNNKEWLMEYEIDKSLLEETNFELLPESYYTLSNESQMVIPSGEYLGEIKVSIDKDKMLNDPKGISGGYALPVKIVASETDSILTGKEYSIIALKAFNQWHGYYWAMGKDTKYDSAGNEVDVVEYKADDDEFTRNLRFLLTTYTKNEVFVPYNGRFNDANRSMLFEIKEDGKVIVKGSGQGSFTNISGEGSYNPETKTIDVKYQYTTDEGFTHKVEDQLIFSNLNLSIEEWK